LGEWKKVLRNGGIVLRILGSEGDLGWEIARHGSENGFRPVAHPDFWGGNMVRSWTRICAYEDSTG